VRRQGDGSGRRHDEVNAFSRVALVESSAQRALVSWRYLPEFRAGTPTPAYRSNLGFTEEQFEISPDGRVIARCNRAQPGSMIGTIH
jgi:hypothetical protein